MCTAAPTERWRHLAEIHAASQWLWGGGARRGDAASARGRARVVTHVGNVDPDPLAPPRRRSTERWR
jgi:hypothetical protein